MCSIQDVFFDVSYLFYPATECESVDVDIQEIKIGGVEIYKYVDVHDQIVSDDCLNKLAKQIIKQEELKNESYVDS
ncbi:hypothetical protein [Sphingobacterium faecium]|uniref:hypothetical protein n=1 Tax=Sphingobacterium faecium TaxID=34087 RepID=UPI0024687150|nr:hypothetical protein [Sphingobacterium faecium]MDH5825809.1 hypothetical protein [Sphingobacterium faecium]